MCYFQDIAVKKVVVEVISELVGKRKRFTGWEVNQKLQNRKGFAHLPPPWQISSYVRELFNGHNSAFSGYACYPVDGGPLLYFPIPYYVRNHVEKIQKEIQTEGQTEK